MKKLFFLLILLALFASACSAPEPLTQVPQTPAPQASASPTLTFTESPTGAPLPPSPTATLPLIAGTLTIKVNVRSGPGTTYASLGLLNAGEKVSIVVRDDTGKWYRILYPATSSGSGWIAAQFVQVASGTAIPLDATPTPTGPTGRVMQRLNVRSGPGLTFTSLGVLEPDGMVSLTGKNATASWFQIDYPTGPGGRGWVTAQYIQTDATGLPVLDDYGTPVASASSGPTPVPVTPTPTVGPAFADNDSPANPAVRVIFSASGTRSFTYSSQVSAPAGDPEDWIEFTPYAIDGAHARLVFSLTCSGNGTLTAGILRSGSVLSGWGTLSCGDVDKNILLPPGQALELSLAPAPGNGLRLVDYILTVRNEP